MPAITPEQQKKLEERQRARTDKMFLATEVLAYDFCPDVHQELFNLYIPYDNTKQWVEQSVKKDRLILWPRGHYKTTSIVVEAIQAILNNPDIRILLMQGTARTTRRLLAEIKSHFIGTAPGSRLRELFPAFCDDKLGHADAFTVPCRVRKQLQQQTVSVAGQKTTTTGQHYDLGFFDDLVNDMNYKNPLLLEKVEEQFKMCAPLIDPGCYRFVTGTRYAFGDLYENLIKANTKGSWIVTIKTCFSDDGKEIRFPQRQVKSGRYVGITREELADMEIKLGPVLFSCQYLNSPISAATQLFTQELMDSLLIEPEKAPGLSEAYLFVDLATTATYRADDSVIAAAKTDTFGKVHCVDLIGGQWSTDTLCMQLIQMTLKHKPLKVLIEKGQSGTLFVDYLRLFCRDKNVVVPIDFLKSDRSKDAKDYRISALEGPMRRQTLIFFKGLPGWKKLCEQIVKFMPGRKQHDDYPDVIGHMMHTLGQQISQTPRPAIYSDPIMQSMFPHGPQGSPNPYVTPPEADAEEMCSEMGGDFA